MIDFGNSNPLELVHNLNVSICFYNVQSPINLGQSMRACEMFHIWMAVHDGYKILEDEDKLKTLNDFSTGASSRLKDYSIGDFENYENARRKQGRFIVNYFDEDAVEVDHFEFKDHDTILIGNEYDDLDPKIIERADAKVYIPLAPGYTPKAKSFSPIDPTRENSDNEDEQGGMPSLNVSQKTTILAYKVFEQRLKSPEVREMMDFFQQELLQIVD